jgi:ribosome-binding protein aMBF1 (putative translation factor)
MSVQIYAALHERQQVGAGSAGPAEREPVRAGEGGVRVSVWRLNRGWSQREIAKRLGVAASTVENWELGQSRLMGEALAKVERLIGAFTSDET